MRHRLIHILVFAVSMLFVPMVVVMPWFQHVCDHGGHSAGLYEHGSQDHNLVNATKCCGDDSDAGCSGCEGCHTEVMGFAFIEKSVVPSSGSASIDVHAVDLLFVQNFISEKFFDTYRSVRPTYITPSDRDVGRTQSLLCVFIC